MIQSGFNARTHPAGMARVSLNSLLALGLRHRLSPVSVKADWKPSSYAIYTLAKPEQRVRFDVTKPTAVWWNRL